MRFTETPFDSPFQSARLSKPARDPVSTGSITPAPTASVQSAPLAAPVVASQALPPPQSAVQLRSVEPLPAYGGAQAAPAPAAPPRVAQAAPETRFVPGPASRPAMNAPVAPAARAQTAAVDARAKADADAAAMRESRARFAAEAKAKAEARKTAAAPAPAARAAAAQPAAPAPAASRTKPVEVASAPATTRPAAAPAPQAAAPVADPKTTASLPKQEEAAVADKADFRWPARGRVIAGFSGRGGNEGINIAVPEGTPIRAAESGTVAYAGSELKGYGNLVLIRHSNGYVSAYAHNGDLKVKRGETVKRGQVVANSGQSGNVSSPQLHFELRKGSAPVDPTPYLNN